jgi:hypothetical protein
MPGGPQIWHRELPFSYWERERWERLTHGPGNFYNFWIFVIEKSKECFCLFTTYLTPLTTHKRVGVNFYFIFKL